MPTIDQQELGICAEQRSEEWEVLSVPLISFHGFMLFVYSTAVNLPRLRLQGYFEW